MSYGKAWRSPWFVAAAGSSLRERHSAPTRPQQGRWLKIGSACLPGSPPSLPPPLSPGFLFFYLSLLLSQTACGERKSARGTAGGQLSLLHTLSLYILSYVRAACAFAHSVLKNDHINTETDLGFCHIFFKILTYFLNPFKMCGSIISKVIIRIPVRNIFHLSGEEQPCSEAARSLSPFFCCFLSSALSHEVG
jgi:hypothetical protein